MPKDKKPRRAPLDPADVIAGRVRPDARELIALIRDVNPTGLGLEPRETARRYAQKSRLQSTLIARFRDAIDVRSEPAEPGVVSLHHRPSGLDACHAVIAELDDDARSWIQHLVDIEATGAHPAPPSDARVPAPARPIHQKDAQASARTDEQALSISQLLREGRDAAIAYDYELARSRFEAALVRSGGDAEPAAELLTLLVDALGADDDALAVEERLSPAALGEPPVRVLLAIAAARRADRERALRLLTDTRARAAYPAARAAEVFVALAKAALTAGELDEVAQDIARAREHDPAHHELLGLSDALAKARAAEREPAEAELVQRFAAGDVAGAEERARALLGRWPDSDVGRRITRAIEAQRRSELATELLGSAREALARGDATEGLALLQRALASGLASEDAAWAEQRIAAIEDEQRARDEQARLAEIRRAILAGDLGQGLPAFAALDAAQRLSVASPLESPPLLWLDQLAPPGAAAKAKAAIPAVLALRRAAEIGGREPAAALDLLRAHDKVLQGFGPAEEIRREAQSALAKQRRRAAQDRVQAAQRALAEGDPTRAHGILGDAQMIELPDDEAAAAEDLRAQIRSALERRALAALLDQRRHEGDDLRALKVIEELLARAEDEDTSRLTALRSELRANVRQTFCVQIEDRWESPEHGYDTLHDADVTPKHGGALLVSSAPGQLTLVITQTRCEWVFIRALDVASGRVRTRVTLRVPAPLELLSAELCDRRLILAGRRGALLEIAMDDGSDGWSIVRWCPNVLRNDEAVRQPTTIDRRTLGMAQVVIEEADVSADGRYLWLNTVQGKGDSGRRALQVLDLDSMRTIREIHVTGAERVYVQPVAGLTPPRIAVIVYMYEGSDEESEDSLKIYDARGMPTGWDASSLAVLRNTVIACPGGERILGVLSDSESSIDPREATWGWVELAPRGGASPMQRFDGVTAVHDAAAVTSLEAGMMFVLFDIDDKGCELFGLRRGSDGLEIAYRVLLPRRAMLLTTPDARHAALVLDHEDRHEITVLGAEPPAAAPESSVVRFHLPSLPPSTIEARPTTCHKPEGARLAAVTALGEKLKREPRRELLRHVKLAHKTAGAEDLLTLAEALLQDGEASFAGELGATAWARFPDNARVRLGHARALSNVAQWSQALGLLSSIDPAHLDAPEVKHLHHLRGMLLLRLDKPEEALAELMRSAACKEGSCELGDLIAICTPLGPMSPDSAPVEWTPEQAGMRALLTLIASADSALGRGDAAAARRVLDCSLVWEASEVQSSARLAEAYLREEEAGGTCDRFRMGLALLSFCELFAAKGTYRYREMPVPRATWSAERLASLAAKARARAEEVLAQRSMPTAP